MVYTIITSGNIDMEKAREAYSLGAKEFLTKPYSKIKKSHLERSEWDFYLC